MAKSGFEMISSLGGGVGQAKKRARKPCLQRDEAALLFISRTARLGNSRRQGTFAFRLAQSLSVDDNRDFQLPDMTNTYRRIVTEVPPCQLCGLRQELPSAVQSNALHAVPLYYSQAQARRARFMLVLQNPALPSSEESVELARVKGVNFLGIHQRYLVEWLRDKNQAFSKGFLHSMGQHGLISCEDFRAYLDKAFLEDFLVTDMLKCRVTTETISPQSQNICANKYLVHELQAFAGGKLIFVFGRRAWMCISWHFAAEGGKWDDPVSKIHGKLFRSNGLDAFFIPLAHFSQRQFNNYLRSSYFDYLDEGLLEYLTTRSGGR